MCSKKSNHTHSIVAQIALQTQLILTFAHNYKYVQKTHFIHKYYTLRSHTTVNPNVSLGKSTKSYYSIHNNCVGDITPANITYTPR